MSVGKNSISRMTKAAEGEKVVATGIITHAPEVPAGDAAPLPKKPKTAKPKTDVTPATTEDAVSEGKAVMASPAKKKTEPKVAAVTKIVRIGDDMPYYLL